VATWETVNLPCLTEHGRSCRRATAKTPHEIRPARPTPDAEVAAREVVELANNIEAVQDGRIHIEKINAPMLFQLKATPAEYKTGLDRAIEKGSPARARHVRAVHASRRGFACLTGRTTESLAKSDSHEIRYFGSHDQQADQRAAPPKAKPKRRSMLP
jgi:hypothetical protein